MRMAEVEERECRICRGEDEPDRPLFHPCRCSGSIKYTHEDCLVNWLSQSGSNRCELCNHSFRFEPLYQPNTPSALPTREFLVGVLVLTKKALRTAARIVLVFTVWLFLLPVGTCWTWYALFINSPSQLPTLLASRGPAGIMKDAFYGFLLSAGIVFIFLGVSSLREYIRQFPQENGDVNEQQPADIFMEDHPLLAGDHEDYSDDDVVDGPHLDANGDVDALELPVPHLGANHNEVRRRNPVRAPDDLPENEDDDIDVEVLDIVDEFVRDTIDDIAGGEDSDVEIIPHDLMMGDESDEDGGERAFAPHGLERALGPYPEEVDDGAEADVDSDFMVGNVYNDIDIDPAGYVEVIADDDEQDEVHVEVQDEEEANDENENEDRGDGGAFFGLFDLDPDDLPLEEVVGLRGHIRNLFDNAGTVLVSNAVFLGVFTLIPLLIGRLTLRLFSMQSFPTRFSLTIPSYSTLLWNMWTYLQANANDLPAHVFHSVKNNSGPGVGNGTSEVPSSKLFTYIPSSRLVHDNRSIRTGALSEISSSSNAASPSVPTSDQPVVSYIDNFLIVLLGYGVIALIAVGYIGVMSMLRRRYPRLDSPLTRQIARMLRYIATFVKIVVLILFEFGIFPLGCGWWLDICTLDIFGGTLQSRLTYCHDSPWACTGLHWFMGIIYMVHISLFISLLREVVRPELLWFLRNPDDPEFHPFRELVEKPLSRHARRMCISVVIYVPLIIALVYVPTQICLKLLPSVFPFRSEDFSHILIDLPFGNLLVGPLIRLLYHGRPEISLQHVVAAWVRWTSDVLGIAHLVVKDDEDRQNNDAHGDDVQGDRVGPGDGEPFQHLFERGESFTGEEDVTVGRGGESDRRWVRIRAILMILSAWATLVIVESALVSVPTIVGRWLMGAVGLPVRHDLHPFLLGLNIILLCASGLLRVGKYIGTLGTVTILSMGMPYVMIALKGSVILFIWLGVIPLATGLLFELILVPVRVGHNETPYFCMHQDWALGLLLLKVWAGVAMTGGLGAKWRERVMRAREGDIIGLNQHFRRSMREVVLPVLFSVVTALSIPYSFARGFLPLVGVSRWVSNIVFRYAYLVIAALYCLVEGARYSVSMLHELHDSIRDDKYLVGKQLHNFTDSVELESDEQLEVGNAVDDVQ